MFGYNFAAAHLGLRHTIAHSFMVSDIAAGGEGWRLIEPVRDADVCYNFPKEKLPHVLHYCQRYGQDFLNQIVGISLCGRAWLILQIILDFIALPVILCSLQVYDREMVHWKVSAAKRFHQL